MRRRLEPLRRLRTLSDARLYAGVLLFAAIAPLLLRLSLHRLDRLLRVPPRRAAGPKPCAAQMRRVARRVDSALDIARPLVRRGCLVTGLTRYYFLRRSGLNVGLSFGVRVAAGESVGHCWLTGDGRPLLEKRDPRRLYAEVFSLPLPAQTPGR